MLYSMASNGSWNNSCVIPSVTVTLLQLVVCIDGCICSAAPEACPPIPSGYDPTLLIYVPFGQTKVYHLQCACKQKSSRTSGQSQLLAWLHMIHEVWLHNFEGLQVHAERGAHWSCICTSTTIATTVHGPCGFVSRYKHNNGCNGSWPMLVCV